MEKVREFCNSFDLNIMVSSELPELLGMCDRIYVMTEGSIAGCFDRKEATQEKILKIALNMN